MPKIHIEQWPAAIETRKGTILDAALSAGVPYPHSCRAGECGGCKTRLFKGEVRQIGADDGGVLTEQERQEGVILACRSWPRSDVHVAWLSDSDAAAIYPSRRLIAHVESKEPLTHDIVRLRLRPQGAALMFHPGQYAQISFGSLPPRSYSMANLPGDDLLEFHIRRVPDGAVSNYVMDRLETGERVNIEGPFGTAYFRTDHQGPIVAAAGGSGLAPVGSILRAAVAARHKEPLHIYFGARSERDIYYEKELAELVARHGRAILHVVLSAPEGESGRRKGFVHEAIAADLPKMVGAKVYVAGPPPMVEGVRSIAVDRGVASDDVHADPFVSVRQQPDQQAKGLMSGLRRLFG